jgi:hypothetical protein
LKNSFKNLVTFSHIQKFGILGCDTPSLRLKKKEGCKEERAKKKEIGKKF